MNGGEGHDEKRLPQVDAQLVICMTFAVKISGWQISPPSNAWEQRKEDLDLELVAFPRNVALSSSGNSAQKMRDLL